MTTTTVTLTGPAAVVATVPRLLGYQPRERVAVAALAGRRVVFTCAAPIPVADAWAGSPAAVRAFTSGGATAAVVVAYTDAPDTAGLLRLADRLPVADVFDVLVVTGGAWRSLLCADPGCCPTGGTPVEATEAVELVGRTGHVAPSREEKAAGYAPDPWTPTPTEQAAATAGMPPADRDTADTLAREALALAAADQPTRRDVLRLAALMTVTPARDRVLRDLPDRAPANLAEAARRAGDPGVRATAAGAAACAHYLTGDPVAAAALVDLAGDDSLAALTDTALRAGVDPAEIRGLFAAISDTEMLDRAGY